MSSWGEFAATEPEFAERVIERFTVRKHSTLATLRRDGSPRISGTEVSFDSGELSLGMMPGSLKARDLQRGRQAGSALAHGRHVRGGSEHVGGRGQDRGARGRSHRPEAPR